MQFLDVLALGLAVLLLGYLVIAMLKPEVFE